MRKIAIIGGAGPQAGSLLYKKIIDRYSSYGVWQDHEFPYIVLFSIPFAPMMEDMSNVLAIKEQLQQVFDQCFFIGVTDIVIACNTLHGYLDGIDMHGIKFYSLIESVNAYVVRNVLGTVMVLSTKFTKQACLYKGPSFCYPDEVIAQSIMRYITLVLQQKDTIANVSGFFSIIESLSMPVVLGCTELSVLYDKYGYATDSFIIDPFDCIIEDMFYLV